MAEPAAEHPDDDMLYSSDEEGAGVDAHGERAAGVEVEEVVLEPLTTVVIFAKQMSAVERASRELAAAATVAAIAALDEGTPPDWLDAYEHKIGAHGLTFGGIAVKVHDPLTEEEDAALEYFDVVHLAIEGLQFGTVAWPTSACIAGAVRDLYTLHPASLSGSKRWLATTRARRGRSSSPSTRARRS